MANNRKKTTKSKTKRTTATKRAASKTIKAKTRATSNKKVAANKKVTRQGASAGIIELPQTLQKKLMAKAQKQGFRGSLNTFAKRILTDHVS